MAAGKEWDWAKAMTRYVRDLSDIQRDVLYLRTQVYSDDDMGTSAAAMDSIELVANGVNSLMASMTEDLASAFGNDRKARGENTAE